MKVFKSAIANKTGGVRKAPVSGQGHTLTETVDLLQEFMLHATLRLGRGGLKFCRKGWKM